LVNEFRKFLASPEAGLTINQIKEFINADYSKKEVTQNETDRKGNREIKVEDY
jgi:hypothetical protein